MSIRTTAPVIAACLILSGCAAVPAPSPSVTPDAGDLISPSAVLGLQWLDGSGDAVFTQSADGSGRRLLFDLPTDTFHPDWSPDGHWVAFRTAEDGRDQIWVARSDGTEARALVTCDDPCFGADFPAWSPDSAKLVYTAYDAPASDDLPPSGSSLRVIEPATGTDTQVLVSGPGRILDNARWSPDGTQLAFQIDTFDATGVETALQVAVAPAEGGDIETITDGSMFGGYPDWNPVDGRIVFCTYDLGPFEMLPDGGASDLFTIESDGTGLTALTESDSGVRLTQPSWTLDGSAVLTTRVDPDGTRSIAVVPGRGGDPVVLPGDGATHIREIPKGSSPS